MMKWFGRINFCKMKSNTYLSSNAPANDCEMLKSQGVVHFLGKNTGNCMDFDIMRKRTKIHQG